MITWKMNKNQWYEALFEDYAKNYDAEVFTRGTSGECDFIEKNTGIDLSESQLAMAREKAAKENLKIDFLRFEARSLPFNGEFDAAIMLCEASFPLMETDEMNFEILMRIARALKQNGKFIFTTLNGLFPLFHSGEKFLTSESGEKGATYRSNTFDLMTFRDKNITELEDDLGKMKSLELVTAAQIL